MTEMLRDDPARRAAEWLEHTYGGLVTLTDDQPLVDGARSFLFGCDYVRGSAEPMLAATIAVPKDGGEPFPVANADPLDEELNHAQPAGLGAQPWRWRVNARGCVVATDAAVDHSAASALPWDPLDEAPGWWDRMLAAHFPGAEVSTCSTWQDVTSVIAEGGPGTRGVVWLRRQLSGAELTGHLLYALHDEEHIVFLDGQRGSLARTDDDKVGQLVVARFHRPLVARTETLSPPWEHAAPDLAAAVNKANFWLQYAYPSDEVVLVQPDEEDETQRGWLFACTTQRFQETGDWRDQMLDAAVVVPKESGAAPFGLPNADPWGYLTKWDNGESGLPEPPPPAAAAWYEPTVREIGPVLSTAEFPSWGGVFSEIGNMPDGARAVLWIRRTDERGRETVGNLVIASNEGGNVRFVDSLADAVHLASTQDPLRLHVISFE